MSVLKNRLKEIVANGAMRSGLNTYTLGIVIRSDEMNNLVDVCFKDNIGQTQIKENVLVRLYGSGTDYFPAVNDTVVVETSGDGCVVIARHVTNYAMDVRSKMKLISDVLSENTPYTTIGGVVF